MISSTIYLGTQIFSYLLIVKKEQIEKEKENKKEQLDKKIEEVCDNGTLEDLLDLRK